MSLLFRSSPRAAAYSHTPPRMASKLSKAGKPCAQSMFPLALLRTKSPAPNASDAARPVAASDNRSAAAPLPLFPHGSARSEERREGKSVELGGGRGIEKKIHSRATSAVP